MDFLAKKKKISYIILACILIITAIIYLPVKDYDFINLDDDLYVLENKKIQDISSDGIIKILFSPNKTKGTRLTILSLAVDYAIGEYNPRVYHLHNLILYLLGIVALFLFIKKMFKRNDFALLVVALFAVLATHIESVVWISQRKDVLYFLLFFLSLFSYLLYLDHKKNAILWLILSFLLFFLAFHAKVAAASLPLILFLIDYYKKRSFSWRLFLEKIPFVIFFLLYFFRYSSSTPIPVTDDMDFKQMQDVLSSQGFFAFQDKFFLASFALLYYLKMFLYPHPIYFVHPYPIKEAGLLPSEYYYSFFAMIILGSLIVYWIYKSKSKNKREWIFGLLFFLVNIALYLHFISIKGIVVVADRYTFVAYVGLIILLVSWILHLMESKIKAHKHFWLPLLLFIYSGLFIQHTIVSFKYIKVWENNEKLYSDLISKNNTVFVAYNNRGIAYFNKKEVERAIADFSRAIEINPNIAYVYNNRGAAYILQDNYNKALADFQKSLQLNPNDIKAQFNLSKCHLLLNNYHEGLKAYNIVLEKDSLNDAAWNDRGKLKNELGMYHDALYDLNKALEINPDLEFAYNNKGISYARLGNFKKAIQNFDKAIEMDNNYADPHMNKANVLAMQKKFTEAIQAYNIAISLNPNNPYAYMNRAACYLELNDLDMACPDFKKAEQLGLQDATQMLKKHCEKK
jgi:tetratricopeptide (TPR) repeat protein